MWQRLSPSSLSPARRGSTRRSRGWGPCKVAKLQKNSFEDVVQPTQDVICGEPEHPEPATHQPGSPSTVVFNSIVVTRAVDLDQQPRLEAGDPLPRPTAGYSPDSLAGESLVRTNGRLPPEPVTLKLLAASARPEQQLHLGHAAAESSGSTYRADHHGRRMQRGGRSVNPGS